jgi:hypothetical protein
VIERDERVRNAQAAFDANQKEIARLQAFVDRYVLHILIVVTDNLICFLRVLALLHFT